MKGKNKMFEKIKELIAEELGADAATITKETTQELIHQTYLTQ